MTKKIMVISLLLLISGSVIYTQSLSQIGFIIKNAIPGIETISVIFNTINFKRIESEARPATLITKKKYIIFKVEKMSDLTSILSGIQKLEKVAEVVISDK